MNTLKKNIRNYLKKHPKLRILARKLYGRLKENRYRKIAARHEIDPKLVIFETFMGRQYGCNPKYIYEYMLTDHRFDDYRLVWVLKEPGKADGIKNPERAEVVEMKSQKYFELYASAKYVVTNSNIDYRIIKKEGQIFLQTWHGTPLKRLRCDIEIEKGNVNNTLEEIKMKNDLDVVRYDYFISPSAFCTEKFTSAFNLRELGKENIIIETGYPRNDLLHNYTQDDTERIKKEIGIPEGKKVILYAPTFRDNRHDGTGYVYDTHLDFERLRQQLGDEYVVLFRAHYFIANEFDFGRYEGFVYNASHLDDITPLYLISDLLITDYSSVFFDYANLNRPILFYMYDLDEYAEGIRGFYIDINELPGPIIKDETDIADSIKSLTEMAFVPNERYNRFNEKYNYLDDGKVSERVVNILFNN